MNDPKYILEIEALLKKMAELEKEMAATVDEQERQNLQKSLKNKEKRLDHLTPFRYKLYLRNLCKQLNIQNSFLP